MSDPDGTAEHDLLDHYFPAHVTIACIVIAVVIMIGAGIAAWFKR